MPRACSSLARPVGSLRDLRAAWTDRPLHYSRRIWALILALDTLPWPLGEELLARCMVGSALLGRRGFRKALAYAAAQPALDRPPWRMALSLCAANGRFIARSALVGLHEPEALASRFMVRGAEHVPARGRGAILISFHLGPRNAYLALRVAGHELTWIGGQSPSPAWSTRIRARYLPGHDVFPPRDNHLRTESTRLQLLYRAQHLVHAGARVFLSADGVGAEAFTISLPGGSLPIRSGWLSLSRSTGAPVLPVLSHMEGRVQVATVHPALPAFEADPERHLESCRQALHDVLNAHVRRYPEQCPTVAFTA